MPGKSGSRKSESGTIKPGRSKQGKSGGKSKDEAEALRRAGKFLHDEIGPLLSAAGLKLQLFRMDFPETLAQVREITRALDEAIDGVRTLSRGLSPSPDYSKTTRSRKSG
jgi:signal transduction histidine kinase